MSWRVSVVEVGLIPGLPRSLYVPDAAPDDELDVPCLVYILDDGEHVVLVDSGPDAEAAARHGFHIEGDTSSSLLRALAKQHLSPRDVDFIVHTHLHYDHCQNDPLFPRAEVIVQRVEYAHAKRGGRFYEGVPELLTSLGPRLTTVEGDTSLLPGLETIANGGHTPGHQSTLVDTPEGRACLCGDIVSLAANLSVIGDSCPDATAARVFLDRAGCTGWEMIPSHEPALRQHRWFVSP